MVPRLAAAKPGVRWEAVDDSSAHATLVDGPLTLKLLFSFNAEGRLDTVRADARERVVDGRAVRAPWQGRFWDYAERSGMRVPLDGEVAWILPEGEKPYWRGATTSLNYEFVKGKAAKRRTKKTSYAIGTGAIRYSFHSN